MAGYRINELTSLSSGSLSADDLIVLFDTSSSLTKQMTAAAMLGATPLSGVVGDGVTDDLPAIQAVIDTVSAAGGGVIKAQAFKTYKCNGVLTLKDNVVLDGAWSVFQFVGATDGVVAQTDAWLMNCTLSVVGISSYTGTLYKIDDLSGYNRLDSIRQTGMYNVVFRGSGAGASATGTALHLLSANGGNGVTNIRILNVRILNFSKGVHYKASGTGWVQGNFASQISTYGCVNDIYLEGDATDGNDFIGYAIQPNTDTAVSSRAIYCESDYNTFIGRTWDWNSSGSSIAHEFIADKSANNILMDSIISPQYVKNAPGKFPQKQFSVLQASRTGLDDTSVQNIFGSTEDELTVVGSTTYCVEATIYITRVAGTTSHQLQWLFGGTCVFNNASIMAVVANPSGIALGTPQMKVLNTKAASTITAANTSSTEHVLIKLSGVVRISSSGTLIPQIQYTAAPGGVPTFVRESYFSVWPMVNTTAASFGPWS